MQTARTAQRSRAFGLPLSRPSPASFSTTTSSTASTTTASTTTASTTPGPAAKPGPAVPAPVTVAAALSVSPAAGPVGTAVSLQASGCPQPAGGWVAFFAGPAALAQPQDPALRHPVTVSAEGGGTVGGTYTIEAGEASGFGLFEIGCGGATNAIAAFNVTGG